MSSQLAIILDLSSRSLDLETLEVAGRSLNLGRLGSDVTDCFTESLPPYRSCKVRTLEYEHALIEVGKHCLCATFFRVNWLYLSESIEGAKKYNDALIQFALSLGSEPPLIVFPDSMFGYDYARELSAVASFSEISQWFRNLGPPHVGLPAIVAFDGNAAISSGYCLVTFG